MVITDKGEQFKVCDECGERFYYYTGASTIPLSDNQILTGHYHYDPEKLGDTCTRCAERLMVDVCHGYCMKWHYKSTLNDEGLCVYCEGEKIAAARHDIYITGQDVGDILLKTRRDYKVLETVIGLAQNNNCSLEHAYNFFLNDGGK